MRRYDGHTEPEDGYTVNVDGAPGWEMYSLPYRLLNPVACSGAIGSDYGSPRRLRWSINEDLYTLQSSIRTERPFSCGDRRLSNIISCGASSGWPIRLGYPE